MHASSRGPARTRQRRPALVPRASAIAATSPPAARCGAPDNAVAPRGASETDRAPSATRRPRRAAHRVEDGRAWASRVRARRIHSQRGRGDTRDATTRVRDRDCRPGDGERQPLRSPRDHVGHDPRRGAFAGASRSATRARPRRPQHDRGTGCGGDRDRSSARPAARRAIDRARRQCPRGRRRPVVAGDGSSVDRLQA